MSTINCELRYAAHPEDVKSYDTTRLRKDFLVSNLFIKDEINMVYTLYDRIIVGGALPIDEILCLEPVEAIKSETFLEHRELGVFNVGGPGVVICGDDSYELNYKEALYLGRKDKNVSFKSLDATNPARFYFNSAVAHTSYPDTKVTKKEASIAELGSLETSNHRVINKFLVRDVLPTCQLQMGMTELKPGSVWNTMPAHTHDRRMEAYFYFEIEKPQAICHFMGQTQETRHIWMQNEEAVISPTWSIHSASGTSNYTFIWSMGGENMDYSDMDMCEACDLR